MNALDINAVRDLEDLLIDCIYAGVIVGQMDQQAKKIKIHSAIGRDVSELDLGAMCEKLEQWSQMCNHMIDSVSASTTQAENYCELDRIREQELKRQLTKLKEKCSKDMDMGGRNQRRGDSAALSQEDADLQQALDASRRLK